MPHAPRRQPSSQASSSHESRSRRSNDSYDSQSTAPTSLYTSPRPSDVKTADSHRSHGHAEPAKYHYRHHQQEQEQRRPNHRPHHPRDDQCQRDYEYAYAYDDDVSPDTSIYPRSSVDTFASTTVSTQDLDAMDVDESPMEYDIDNIPPLPVYRREVVEPNVRASTPQDFAKLFPSLNRLTIRHDEFTPDGNMNLRVDTVVTGRRRTAIQLFHLRMYDLAKREFSLRRYCRDSGREVCNSKRKYDEPTGAAKPKAAANHLERPTLKRSVSTAIKSLGSGRPMLRRAKSTAAGRPGTGYSTSDGDDELVGDRSTLSALSLDGRSAKAKASQPMPTNTIKLEFSNYARVDVHRRGGRNNKRYEFEWWGHRYAWKRSVDKQLGLVSFHLLRDGDAAAPVAHIVPETRSPTQVLADDNAGGWVPPCFMWIADEAAVDAVTDVAE